MHKKKSPRIYTSMHSGGFELTKLTYTRLEDNLIRHPGDRWATTIQVKKKPHEPTKTATRTDEPSCSDVEEMLPIPANLSVGVHGAKKKKRKIISGVYWRVCHQNEVSRGFSTVYSSTTNDFRYTHRSTDYRPITRSIAGRGCHVSLCWGPLCPASCSVLFM